MRFVQAGALLLGALMWATVAAFGSNLATSTNFQWFFVIAGAWNLLLLGVTVFAIVDSIRKVRAKKTQQLSTDALVVKLAAIPFFAFSFVALALPSHEPLQ